MNQKTRRRQPNGWVAAAGVMILAGYFVGSVTAYIGSQPGPSPSFVPVTRQSLQDGPWWPAAPPSASAPSPTATAAPSASSTPKPTKRPTAWHSLSGSATYYCKTGASRCTAGHPDRARFDAYAAAGPALRVALGPNWRGRVVYVDGIRVTLIDWCLCTGAPDRLIDLYWDVFALTGSRVTIAW